MTNQEIARIFRHVAVAYTIKDEKKHKFQILAYQKAADTIESLTTEVKYLFAEGKIDSLPGIGLAMRQHIEELLKTGKVEHFKSILEGLPPALFPLLDIPSFGPKKSFRLVTHFHLNNPKTVISELEKLAKAGKIAELEGFGEKSQEDILQAIIEYKNGLTKSVRMSLPYANELAEKFVEYMKKCPDVKEIYPLGSLRRRRDTIGDVDLAVSTTNAKSVISYFTAYPYKERILEEGDVSAGLLVGGGKHIDLMAIEPEKFASLLQHFTGSKTHNIHLREIALKKNLSISEKGVKDLKTGKVIVFKTEKELYNFFEMDWIPPEIREDTGEIDLALKHSLPKLVEISDIKGDFHLHSSFPIEPSHDMGQDTMEAMIEKAKELSYKYIGFSEHNPSSSRHTEAQIIELLKRKRTKIDQLNVRYKKSIQAFNLLEVDIQPNGDLAVPESAIPYLNGMLVSIHSVFSMDKETMTKRVLKGLSHPKAKILTHPSGRLINQRPGYELDWQKIFEFCKVHNKAIEINAYPDRLDLVDVLVRKAIDTGVLLVINTDSHAKDQMDLMRYGVSVARRGWASKLNILNTKEYNEVKEWFAK